jgi:hypothetical protein
MEIDGNGIHFTRKEQRVGGFEPSIPFDSRSILDALASVASAVVNGQDTYLRSIYVYTLLEPPTDGPVLSPGRIITDIPTMRARQRLADDLAGLIAQPPIEPHIT